MVGVIASAENTPKIKPLEPAAFGTRCPSVIVETQTARPPSPPIRSSSSRGDAVLEIVRALYTELHRAQPESVRVTWESALERDLGFDSLARVELLRRLEQQLGIRLPEDTLASAETVGDLLHTVTAAQASSSALPGTRAGIPSIAQPATARPRLAVPDGAATLNEVLEWRAQTTPDATHAIVLDEGPAKPLTYAELLEGARRVASALRHAGVEARATVALMLPTSAGYFHAFLGVLLAGAVPVPIYPPIRPSQLEEHVHRHAGILANAGVDVLVTIEEARGVARLLSVKVPTLRRVLSIAELLLGGPVEARPSAASRDSIAMLQYTSGSTGAPKGVILTHGNLLANIRALGKAVNACDSDILVSWLPLYHDMGLIGAWLGSLYFGCLFIVMPPTAFLARPARWLQAISDYRATISASPNFGYEMCARRVLDEDLRGLDLSCWRVASNGAEPVFPDTIERFSRRFIPYGFRPQAMTPVYGLAEAAVGLTFPPPDRGPLIDSIDRDELMRNGRAIRVGADHANALRFVSCGRPLPGYQVRIVDSGDAELPERIEGDVHFMGPSATAGYYNNAAATERLFHGEWLDTGDRGYMAEGELYLTGRVKDIVIRRGRHIYPDEIERAVGDLEGVRRGCVAVFGAQEPATATEKLIVVAETSYAEPSLRDRLRMRINERVVEYLGEPPEEILLAPPHSVLKTSSGKLRRAATRAAYEDGSLGRAPPSPLVQMLRLSIESLRPALRRLGQAALRLAYGVYALCVAVVILTSALLIGLVLPRRRQVWRLAHHTARWLIRAWRIPFSVEWQTERDLPGPHIVVINHASYVDSIFVAAVLPDAHVFVAKTELQRFPILRIGLRRLGTLFIERFAPVESAHEVGRLRQELDRGNSLAIFPEGGFNRVTGLRAFHLGAFQIAVASGAPVVPLTLRGTRSVLRDGQFWLRRMPVSAVVGRPLAPPTGSDEDFAKAVRLRDAAREQILHRCGEPDLL